MLQFCNFSLQVRCLWAAFSTRSVHRCHICTKKMGSRGMSVCSIVKTTDTRMQGLITAANAFVGIISWHTLKSHRVIVKRSQSQSARKSNLDVKLLRTSKFSEQVKKKKKSLNTCRFSNVSSLFCKATNFSCSRFYVTIGGQSWICISTWTLTPPCFRWLSECHHPFWLWEIYFDMKCPWCCQSKRHRFDRNVIFSIFRQF